MKFKIQEATLWVLQQQYSSRDLVGSWAINHLGGFLQTRQLASDAVIARPL